MPQDSLIAADGTALSLNVPDAIGDLQLEEVRKPTESVRSTQFVYKAPGLTLTLFIFCSTPEPPDGIESNQLNAEFLQAKAAIQDPRAWKHAALVREGTALLGTAPHMFSAREAVFKVKSDEAPATSYLYLTAHHGLFFKTRYTVRKAQLKIGEAQLPAIRQTVGELIEQSAEQTNVASDTSIAKRPVSTPDERAKAVQLARELETDPMAAGSADKRRWLIHWYERVPDISVTVCNLFGPLPKIDHPYFPQVLTQSMFSGGAFIIEHPDQANTPVAVQTAGMLGALKVYEVFVRTFPDERLPFLDELVKQRDDGTLVAHMTHAVAEGCK
jgi:hypothetical protein